ncbi:hypothetical protein FDG2_1280 [Candidatus Protofrankia californiensis]|uniref:Uncharacterized protein n=1 Tax=Candidatus Protofrankia californiensis TaxID=1839754 RepID=A0A1C3NVD1_9ACTN|nr:hypothetical protein FDG2_1280 [Candidatus Protofrankia californiensis]
MRAVLPLQLTHDIAIKVKYEVQSEKPWSGDSDAGLVPQSVTVHAQVAQARAWVPSR